MAYGRAASTGAAITGPAHAGAASGGAAEGADRPRETRRLDAAAYLRRGFDYLERPSPDDQREAERLLRKAIRLDAALGAAHAGLSRASSYLYTIGEDTSAGRLDTALAEAREAVRLAPEAAPSRVALALALAASDRLTPALAEADRAVALDPGAASAHAARCGILRLAGENEAALASCSRAAGLAPDDPRVLSGFGDALRENGRREEAIEMYGQAIDLDHEAIAPQLGLAATFQKAGAHPGARRIYNRLLTEWDYGRDRVLLGVAALFVDAGERAQALGVYETLEVGPGAAVPALLTLYGKAWCLLGLEREAEAEYFLSALIARVPRDYDGPARGRDLLFRAYDDLVTFFEARGRDGRATALLREAVTRDRAPTSLARRLAARLQARKDTGEAARLLEQALARSDRREDPLEIAATVLAMARLRKDGGRRIAEGSPAAEALRAAAERIDAGAPGAAHYDLARAQALLERDDDAIRSLKQARLSGYLPQERLTKEPEFERLRDAPAFQALLPGGADSRP